LDKSHSNSEIYMKCPDCGCWMKNSEISPNKSFKKPETVVIEHVCPFCGTVKWSFLERASKLQKEKVIFT